MLPTFNYKINKSITFGIIDKNEVFKKTLKNSYYIEIGDNKWELNLKNGEDVYNRQIKNIISIIKYLISLFEIIFEYEKYHKFDFDSLFKKIEKKKIKTGNLSKKALKSKIWNKYLKKFFNLKNNLQNLENTLENPEYNLERLSNIVRTIRYTQGDLEKLFNFIENYEYFGGNKEKKEILNTLKNSTTKDEIKEFLEYFSKKDTNQFLIYKIALNPAILNTHSEVAKQYFEEIKDLNKDVRELAKKDENNDFIKRKFEEELEAVINYILYQKGFFKKGEGKLKVYFDELGHKYDNYYNFSEIIFNKYKNSIDENNGDDLEYYEKLVKDFLQKHGLEAYFRNPNKWIEVECYILKKFLKQAISIKKDNKNQKSELENILNQQIILNGKKFYKYNLIQLKTLLYEITWKIAELKKEGQSYELLSAYKREVKGKINSIYKNKKTKYGDFIKPDGYKAKIAKLLGQKSQELLQKGNYDKELKQYTHFSFIVRKGVRFFILPFKKEDILNNNGGFTFEDAKNLLKDYLDENGEYETYIFKSLTLKALNKLIFLKNAFEIDWNNEKYKKIRQFYKRKTYLENAKNKTWKENLKELIEFYLEVLNYKKAKELFPYIDLNFKSSNSYNSLADFEKDLLKNAYKIKKYKINIDENELIELDIVNRSFEIDNTKIPRLKRQKDIKLFVNGFFNHIANYEKNGFDKIRLLPEIKIYVRYEILKGELRKEKRGNIEIDIKRRFYKDVYKASFLFELNPLGIGQNPLIEIKRFNNKLLEKKDELHYIGIDVGENELATLGVYKYKNGKLLPQDIKVDGKLQKIINLTDLKVDNGKIITKKGNFSNSEKFKAIKYVFKQILLGQIYLKDILEKIGEIEIKQENYGNIQKQVGNSVSSFPEIENWDNNTFNKVKKYFSNLGGNLSYAIFNYIKQFEGEKIDLTDKKHYHAIFDKLQLAKVVNLKDAFSSNFIGVILKILEQYPGLLIFEALHTGKSYNAKDEISKINKDDLDKINAQLIRDFNTYFFPYLLKSVFNKLIKVINYTDTGIDIKQYVYLNKNFETSICKLCEEKYGNNGILYWVDEKYTSKACPVCNDKLYGIEYENIKTLYGHGKGQPWESNMHHCDNPKNCPDIGNHISKENKSDCDYHMKKNNYGFDFIKSGDDLAAYNIAKKGKEYFNF